MASHTSASVLGNMNSFVTFPLPATNYRRLTSLTGKKDVWHGGTGVISGTVKEAGTPDLAVHRRVRLHRKNDGVLVAEMWSALDGTYSFSNLMMQLYYVVSFDHTGNYNAVVKDSITPDPT